MKRRKPLMPGPWRSWLPRSRGSGDGRVLASALEVSYEFIEQHVTLLCRGGGRPLCARPRPPLRESPNVAGWRTADYRRLLIQPGGCVLSYSRAATSAAR
jgi:hypothetical protein